MNDADDLPLIVMTGILSVIQWTTAFFLHLIQVCIHICIYRHIHLVFFIWESYSDQLKF